LPVAIASSIRSHSTIGSSGPKISSRVSRDLCGAPITSVGASLRLSAKPSPAGLISTIRVPARRRAVRRGSRAARREKAEIVERIEL